MRHNRKDICNNCFTITVVFLLCTVTNFSYANDPRGELNQRYKAYQDMAKAKFNQSILSAGEDMDMQKIAQSVFELDKSRIEVWYENIEIKFRLIEDFQNFTYEQKVAGCSAILSKSQDPISMPIVNYKVELQKQESPEKNKAKTNRSDIRPDKQPQTINSTNIPIECIFYSKEKPEAIVDGKIVHEGNTIRGFKILRIYEDSIEFENGGNTFRQHISDNQENEYTIKKETVYKNRVSPSSYVHIEKTFSPIQIDEKEPERPRRQLTSRDNTTEMLHNSDILVQNPKFEKEAYQVVSKTKSSEDRGKYIGQYTINKFAPHSISNSFGTESQFRSDSINNKFGKYGSEFSLYSVRNSFTTQAPKLYDSHGNYRGRLSNNRFDADSISNTFGRYGSSLSPDSVNNPFGAGNPFSPDSPTNKFGQGLSIYGDK